MHQFKLGVLTIAKFLGLFYLARKASKHGLRILCYHGFSLHDEHLFRPKLFMTKERFAQRLEKISEMGFTVISLDQAVQRLAQKQTISDSIVLTFDDGWQGVEDIAWPLLQKYGYPWTLYLTTYYTLKRTQVMNIALQYLCWKTIEKEVNFSHLGTAFSQPISLHDSADQLTLAERLNKIGESYATAAERQAFLHGVAEVLKVDQSDIEKKRLFYILNAESVKKLHDGGGDIELHTHRHSLGGSDEARVKKEIEENYRIIDDICHNHPRHFCYPSGYHRPEHMAWLAANGVVSATTCNGGLNYPSTPLLALTRFLDGENISAIEFESELSGFSDFLRKLKRFG